MIAHSAAALQGRTDTRIVYLNDTDRHRALILFSRLSRERKISLRDAISAAVAKDRLAATPCLAFDDDFRTLGLSVV
jgi:predicted nucleic acid-binding protein